MARQAPLEHDFTLLIQVGIAPSTDSIEQCKRCGIVRLSNVFASGNQIATTVRWFRNGIPSLPAEDCK